MRKENSTKQSGRTKQIALRPGLTREKIISTAMGLADKNGIESISMRQLALDLGVEAMSLYKHVINKDDLLDGMIEMVVAEIPSFIVAKDWKTSLRDRSLKVRLVLNKHPWAASLLESSRGTGPARLKHHDELIRIFRQAGFTVEQAYNAIIALNSYVYGFVIQEQAWCFSPTERPKVVQKNAPTILPSEFPYVFEMMNFVVGKSSETLKAKTKNAPGYFADFEFGLNIFMDGLEKVLGKKQK